MLHIGILAHSADGSALCYLEIVRHSARLLGPHEHPEITLTILPMGPVIEAYRRHDLVSVRAHLAGSAERLVNAGCSFFVCPDNTAHIALETSGPPLALAGLHIATIVAERARSEGRRRVGLLGTRWTMEGPVYPAAFARAGIDLSVPEAGERGIIDNIIFGELCQGVIRAESQAAYVSIIEDLKREHCDAVALSCTEIPLLVPPDVSPLPTLDSTRLLAHAAVEVALGRAPMPTWRGGPIT